MARHSFLGDFSSWVMDNGSGATSTTGLLGSTVVAIGGQQVTFWSAATAGTQYADLLDATSNPITSVTSAADGSLPQISGPDGVTSMWADASGGAGPRRLAVATDLGTPGIDWINVKTAYGAKGDGSTDDTTAIQATLNAANTAGGGTVYFPAGTYKVSAALTVYGYITLLGAGDQVTVIQQTSTAANALTGTDITQFTLRGIKLLGPGSGTGKGIAFGLSAHTNTGFLDFQDVWVHGFGSDGISLATPIVSAFTRVISEHNGGNGWTTTSGTSSTSCSWNACYANANTGYGYSLTAQCYSSLNGCAADANGNGYFLSGCQSVALNGCGSESSVTDNFILSGGFGNTLNSCRVLGNAHYGIHITGGEKTASLIGCVDNTPAGGAVNFIKTDTGTACAILNDSNITANSLASGTASTLGDASGEFVPAGTAFLNGTQVAGQLASFASRVVRAVTKTAAYTAGTSDEVILADATSAAFTVTLPTAAGNTGLVYTIIKVDSSANQVTVATTSSQTINGATTYTTGLAARYGKVRVISNGSNWLILNT